MENIQVLANGMYLPKNKVENKELAKKFGVDEEYIYQRTGINTRFFIEDETIEEMALQATQNLFGKENACFFDKQEIDLIIVGTTTTNKLMPGISYHIQNRLDIKDCMCMDILAGCNSYINSLDIARNYIAIGKIRNALVIGVDILSKYTDKEDIGTAIILSDGAGATLIGKSNEQKKYYSCIESKGQKGEILTCNSGEKIYMDGKEIYKYAVTKTVENIEKVLKEANESLEKITYIVPHQSNKKIIKAIESRLKLPEEKMYTNIEKVGNTFCASIPIALCQMEEEGLLQKGDKILLLGYGGGLNTGSILMEV